MPNNCAHDLLFLPYLFFFAKFLQPLTETQNHIINIAFYLEAKGMKEKKKEVNIKSVTEQVKIATLTVTPASDLIVEFDVYCQSYCVVFR